MCDRKINLNILCAPRVTRLWGAWKNDFVDIKLKTNKKSK